MKWDQAKKKLKKKKKSLVLRLTQRKWDHPAAVAGRWKDDVCFVLADSPTGLSARRFCHFLSFTQPIYIALRHIMCVSL